MNLNEQPVKVQLHQYTGNRRPQHKQAVSPSEHDTSSNYFVLVLAEHPALVTVL
jgi:hypothetical protein